MSGRPGFEPGRTIWAPGALAPSWKRALNFCLDTPLVLGLVFLLSEAVQALLALGGYTYQHLALYVPLALLLPVLLLYYVGFEGLCGRTPAKFLTGTRVVMEDGSRPTLSALVRRTLGRLFTRRCGTPHLDFVHLHDAWSGTRVLNR